MTYFQLIDKKLDILLEHFNITFDDIRYSEENPTNYNIIWISLGILFLVLLLLFSLSVWYSTRQYNKEIMEIMERRRKRNIYTYDNNAFLNKTIT